MKRIASRSDVRRRTAAGFAGVAAVLLSLVWGCDSQLRDRAPGPDDAPAGGDGPVSLFVAPARPAPRPDDYVGSAACRECHADTCDLFAAHPMGRSLTEIDATFVESVDVGAVVTTRAAPRSDLELSYRVETDGERLTHHEIVRTPDGEVVYDLEVPVRYAVGSGTMGHSFLVERDGVLVMSPLTWYAEKAVWGLSPGYESANLQFTRRVSDLCVQCHSGRANPLPGQPDRYADPVFFEQAIGCEKCHGPGGGHAEFHAGGGGAAADDPLVRLGELSDWKLNQVCFQCHLNDDLRLTKYGRSHGDFRPGDDLSDTWMSFVRASEGRAANSDLAVGQVQQMMSSGCYAGSGGAMTCVTCHDPHKSVRGAEAVSHYRAACVSCHDGGPDVCAEPLDARLAVTGDDSCVVCHMPKKASTDVVHVAHTDHRVPRVPATPAAGAGKDRVRSLSGELTLFGGDRVEATEAEIGRAGAIAVVRQAEKTGDVSAVAAAIPVLEEWVKVAPPDSEAQVALAQALTMVGEEAVALRVMERALETDPDHEYYLRQMLVLLHELRAADLAADYGRRLVAVNPYDFEYQGRLSHVLGRSGDPRGAIEAAKKAIELNPGVVQIHEWLANLYEATGDAEAADRHRRTAAKLSR